MTSKILPSHNTLYCINLYQQPSYILVSNVTYENLILSSLDELQVTVERFDENVSGHDQEIPQSHAADQPTAQCGRAIEH